MTQNNEREEFEAFVKSDYDHNANLKTENYGIVVYKDDEVESMWMAWQARAQSPISQNEQQPKQIPDGWISVEDRLPTDDRTVICADYGKFKINDYIPAPDEIFGCNFYKGNWLGDAFGDYPYILKVTHWMPLPTAPTNTEVGE